MKKYKLIISILLYSTAALILTGCSSEDSEKSNSVSSKDIFASLEKTSSITCQIQGRQWSDAVDKWMDGAIGFNAKTKWNGKSFENSESGDYIKGTVSNDGKSLDLVFTNEKKEDAYIYVNGEYTKVTYQKTEYELKAIPLSKLYSPTSSGCVYIVELNKSNYKNHIKKLDYSYLAENGSLTTKEIKMDYDSPLVLKVMFN